MEDSSEDQRPRCPCGFWGTQQTLGLCSKCYREAQKNKNQSSSDSSKPPIGSSSKSSLRSYHTQSTRNESGPVSRMDSKHFPSHSTTDNLPSSLSTPGERQLNPAPTASTAVDTSDVTTMTNAGPSHISAEGSDLSPISDNGSSRSISGQIKASSSELSSQSSSMDDPNYDVECASAQSSVSVVSVPLSTATSLSGLHSPIASVSQESSIQNNISTALTNAAAVGTTGVTSASSSTPSKLNNSVKDSVTSPTNLISSSKDISVKCDVKDQSSSNEAQKVIMSEKQESKDTVSQSPQDRGLKRTREEMEASPGESIPPPSPQKNKKRCFTCSCKLELAQRTIGRCRCDRVFCSLHRLPELHNCDFNHKEDGRREAREKMIKPTRHLGTSFRRDDNL